MDSESSTKGAKWHGFYDYHDDNRDAMIFDNFYIADGVVKGDGSDAVGEFDIDGTIDHGNV